MRVRVSSVAAAAALLLVAPGVASASTTAPTTEATTTPASTTTETPTTTAASTSTGSTTTASTTTPAEPTGTTTPAATSTSTSAPTSTSTGTASPTSTTTVAPTTTTSAPTSVVPVVEPTLHAICHSNGRAEINARLFDVPHDKIVKDGDLHTIADLTVADPSGGSVLAADTDPVLIKLRLDCRHHDTDASDSDSDGSSSSSSKHHHSSDSTGHKRRTVTHVTSGVTTPKDNPSATFHQWGNNAPSGSVDTGDGSTS